MDLQLIIALGALVVAVLAALSRSLDKSLSIREHEEFSKNVHTSFIGIKEDYKREIDRIERRLDRIEDTRPTTGELEATMSREKDSRGH